MCYLLLKTNIWTLALGITTASSVIVGKLVGKESYEKAVDFSKK